MLVRDVFHGSAGLFSAAVVAFGAGGLLGAAGLLGVPVAVDRRRLSSWSAIAIGSLLVLIALSPSYWAVLPLLVFAGAAVTVSNTAANSLLQATASARLLGRTVSLYMLAIRGGMSIGALLTGVTVSLLGVRSAFAINGVLAVVLQAALASKWLRTPLPAAGKS